MMKRFYSKNFSLTAFRSEYEQDTHDNHDEQDEYMIYIMILNFSNL